MDYYFKKFSVRRSQDVQFEQARDFPVANNAVYNNQNVQNEDKKLLSPRKKVNVVSFSTGEPPKITADSSSLQVNDACQKSHNSPTNVPDFRTPYPTIPSNLRKDEQKNNSPNNHNRINDKTIVLGVNSQKKDRRLLYNPRSWQNDSEIETKITIKPLNESSKGSTITKTIRKSEPTFKTPMLPVTSEFDMFPSDDEPNNLKIPKLKSHKERLGPRVTFADQPELKQENKKLLVKKSEKELFTVVKNTNNAAQCQDKGSTQHSNDDFRYLIEGIGKENMTNTRSLSILTLANRCVDKNFRKILKPNRCLSIISEKLEDAYLDFSLGLTTACLIYIISRERDPSHFNQQSMKLMMSLIKTPNMMTSLLCEEMDSQPSPETQNTSSKASSLFSSSGKFSFASRRNNLCSSGNFSSIRLAKESERLRHRIKATLEMIKPKRNPNESCQKVSSSKVENLFSNSSSIVAENPLSRLKFKHIDIEKPINARDLIIESLINIGLRKTSSQFKSMIREHEAIDHIAEEIIASVDYLKDLELDTKLLQAKTNQIHVDEFSISKLKKIFHYTRFLENMTYLEVDNQAYLVRYKDGQLISQLVRIIRICSSQLPKHPSPSKYLSKCLAISVKGNEENEKLPVVQIYEKMAQQYPMIIKPSEEQTIILDCLTRTYRLMVNLSQNEFVSHVFNSVSNVVEVTMDIVLHMPNRLPESHRFDLLVLTLCTLVNQCQHFPENKSRIVHMELPTIPCKDDEDKKIEEEQVKPDTNKASLLPWDDKSSQAQVFDEIISLFLYRDELVKSHDFERDDGQHKESENPMTIDNPEVADDDDGVKNLEGKTIEEAGLKWRLVKQNSQSNGSSTSTAPSNTNTDNEAISQVKRKSSKNGDGPVKKKKSRLRKNSKKVKDVNNSEESDEDEIIESAEEDKSEEEDDDDDLSDEDSEEEDTEEGVDVEFVTETKEDKDRLKEQMSSAHQHMEDSVVAAYVALLLGCIIQTSSRYTEKIRKKLPDGKFRPMAIMLAKLCSFLSLTQNIDNVAHENISRVIKNLESLDQPTSTKTPTSATTTS